MTDSRELVKLAQAQQQARRYAFLVQQANGRIAEQIRQQSNAPIR